ncbi:MAG: hypothetical protein GXY86_15920 [Firmicutes bacterium]|nr:hypothetical protein [Bacillota bacterium]
MLSDHSKGIPKLIFTRICQIQDEILTNDPEYKELGKVPAELFNLLFHKLPQEDRDILEDYDSGRMGQLNRQDEILYSRGLMDGIRLYYWLERIGRGEVEGIL